MFKLLKQGIASFFKVPYQSRLGRRAALFLLLFHLSGVAFELVGLFSLLPLFQFLQNGGDVAKLVATDRSWQILRETYAWLGLPLRLETLLATSFALLMLRQATVFTRLRYTARVVQEATAQLRLDIFQTFLAARIEAQEREPVGVIVNEFTTELQRGIQYVLSFVTLCGFVIVLVVYSITVLAISPIMTAMAFLTFGGAYLLLMPQIRRSAESGARLTEANQEVSSFVIERLRQLRLIRLAGIQRAEFEAMKRLVDNQRKALTRVAHLLANVEVIVEPVVVAMAFIFLFVAVSILHMELAQVGLFLVILVRLLPVVKEGSRVRQSMKSTKSAYDAVLARIEVYSAAAERLTVGSERFNRLAEGIRFRGVTFSYSGAAGPAIVDVTLSFPASRMTALVGPSGAGKSTLIDLLPRLRSPQVGTIFFDDIPHDRFDIASLRNGIAFAPQVPEMFNVTVAEHIRYGKADATDDEVRQAARLAQAEDFIRELPLGYDTLIGENGGLLSGGQRQRLDLARAIVRKAPVLVLDEPTSNLDGESEAKFLEALQHIKSETGTTLIVIAHRPSTVAIADQIVVMEAGRIRAVGSHDELLVQDAWYRKVFQSRHLRETRARLVEATGIG